MGTRGTYISIYRRRKLYDIARRVPLIIYSCQRYTSRNLKYYKASSSEKYAEYIRIS
jgi:hypothetical protein